ncbi:MAG: hypothetical protein DRP68_03770 [Candidatus Omnitrophota bacterium]|nr:MAG: hypothetical protein DRP68_03770 [Candidatus Omnitrophota bacterium]
MKILLFIILLLLGPACTSIPLLLGSEGITHLEKGGVIVNEIDVDSNSLLYVSLITLKELGAEITKKGKEEGRIEAFMPNKKIKILITPLGETRSVIKVKVVNTQNKKSEVIFASQISKKIYRKAKKIWEW